jgi:acetyl esterase/lipase
LRFNIMENRPRLTLFAMLVLVTVFGGCATHQRDTAAAPAPLERYEVAQILTGVVFTGPERAEPLEGDLYLPGKPDKHAVVLMVHGGGWASRDRNDMTGISEKLARHGYAVLNVSYRFAPAHTFPAQLLDLRQALAWLAVNADRYSLDVDRINVWGYSSGAHLGALLASYDFEQTDSIAAYPALPGIRAVVAGGTPADLRKYSRSPVVMRFLGGARDELPELYAEASPISHVSADDPPVFLYHGKLDLMVTVDQATDYYAALRAKGVEAELYVNPWLGHLAMFVLGGDAEAEAIEFLNRKNSPTLIGGIL